MQPKEQDLGQDDLAKLLAGGLMLCICLSDNSPSLMGEIINYMNSEFVNTTSFEDGEVL